MKSFDAFAPGRGVRRRVAARPISFRPFRRDVLRVAAEFDDVPLRDSQMLEQSLRGMGLARRLFAAQVRRKIGSNLVKLDVCASALQ